jgi:hypothetical protein
MNQNRIHKGNVKRVNLGKACYYSAQNILYSLLLPQNTNIILPPVLYECENCSFTLKEEHLTTAFKRKISGPKREELTG